MSAAEAIRDPRAWLRARPMVADGLLAVVLIVCGLVQMPMGPVGENAEDFKDPDLLAAAFTVATLGTVAWRRRAPLLAILATSIIAVPQIAFDYQGTIAEVIGWLCLIYSLAAYRGLAKGVLGGAIAFGGYAVVLFLAPGRVQGGEVVFTVATICGIWWLGRSLRLRRAYLVELESRAERLERARDSHARAARAEERSRIARELHDVVAHHVSVMTVQAGAARRILERDPDRAREALSTAEQMGRTALAEMRRIVGVLRTESDTAPKGDLTPQPGMSDVERLCVQLRETGFNVGLTIDGDTRPLSPGIDLTAYRLVQEALTNSLKHAGPRAHAWVRIHYGERQLSVDVEDDGRGLAAGLGKNGDGPGLGLVGMRERVGLYGGELRVGPRSGGGFEVHARFPLEAE